MCIFLSNNTQETRRALFHAGIELCSCCNFKGAEWLSVSMTTDNSWRAHGLGYGCENTCEGMCPKKCTECAVRDAIKNCKEVHLFKHVDDLVKFLDI